MLNTQTKEKLIVAHPNPEVQQNFLFLKSDKA